MRICFGWWVVFQKQHYPAGRFGLGLLISLRLNTLRLKFSFNPFFGYPALAA
eukprot:m.309824 g.309824  ORF g.309824 m.309824 type:complete len:52 (+) comp48112_c0_seq1:846-1001(+)